MQRPMPDIYATLCDRIISGACPAETRLKEEQLGNEFEVSRTPVREALRMLAQDGLVRIPPRRSAVQNLSIQSLKDLRARLLEASRSTDFHAHQAIDAELHNALIAASRKKRLTRILQQMFRLIQQFRKMGFRDLALQETTFRAHLGLVDALAVRDLTEAERILPNHIEVSKKNAISLIVRGEPANAP